MADEPLHKALATAKAAREALQANEASTDKAHRFEKAMRALRRVVTQHPAPVDARIAKALEELKAAEEKARQSR